MIRRIAELETQHGSRRYYPWQKLGLSPLATALEPLAELAVLCKTAPGAPTPEAYARLLCQRRLARGCRRPRHHGGMRIAGSSTAQCWALCGPSICRGSKTPPATCNNSSATMGNRFPSAPSPSKRLPGRLVLFADGLRMDVARQLAEKLTAAGIESTLDWEWSTIPSVTATAKPAASPIADAVQGGEAGDEFTTRLVSTGQLLTQDRFAAALKARGWQCLGADETGDPSGSAWTEAGALDKRGHTEGWKLARSVEAEVRDLVSRIGALLKAGWTEVIVVTDHGWLLVPGGLPKVELKSFLTETPLGSLCGFEGGCPDRRADVQVALESGRLDRQPAGCRLLPRRQWSIPTAACRFRKW